MWIPQENENSQGKTGDQTSPQTRTQTSNRIRLTFPKSARILKKNHFQGVMKSGHKLCGRYLIVDYRLGKSSKAKLGLTVSKKYGKAHRRNRFKRVVREAFRTLYPQISPHLEVNILPRLQPGKISKNLILSDLQELIAKIPLQ